MCLSIIMRKSKVSEYLTVHFVAVNEYARLAVVRDYLKNKYRYNNE